MAIDYVFWRSQTQDRIGEQRLKELTNHTSATTVNNDTLDAAIDDAVDTFNLETGLEVDSSNSVHKTLMHIGIIYFLEEFKNRDSILLARKHQKYFGALNSYKRRLYVKARYSGNEKTRSIVDDMYNYSGFNGNWTSQFGCAEVDWT